MEKESFSQKVNRLIRENVRITITKTEIGKDTSIKAEIEGNPVATAYAMFQVAVENNILFESLMYFMRLRELKKNESHD